MSQPEETQPPSKAVDNRGASIGQQVIVYGNATFGGTGEGGSTHRRLQVIDFSAERNRHKHFFGREDVLAEMNAWVNEGDGGWLVITGSPGLGKSALMDRWLRRREAAGSLTAFHFIRRGHLDWAEPQVVQRNLATRIEVMFPEQRDPNADPIYRLEQLLARVGPVLVERRERLVLLVDGLDEAVTLGKDNPVPYIFPLEVPKGVFVVTASRPRYPHLNWFHRRTGATTWIDLDERVESNEQAVREHWQWLGTTMEPPLREELVHAAIEGARGNLLHAVKLFELWSRPKAERSPGDVPQGFEGMLEELWERTGTLPKDAKERVRDGLSLISAARESLPLRVVDELLRWDDGEAEDELLPLAREMLLEEPWHEEPAYRLFHEGLRELVERKRRRSIREHHGLLSEYATWPIEGDAFRRSYALRHRVEHRVEADQLDAAAKACMDVAYLTAKTLVEGVLAVERDIRLAAEACKDGETRGRLTTLGGLVAASSHWANEVPEALPALLHDRALTNAPEILESLLDSARPPAEHPRLRHPLQIRGMSRILQGHRDGVTALAALPNGRVISGSNDKTLRVWDAQTGQAVATFQVHQRGMNALAVLSNGRIISGSDDKMLRVWDMETGRVVAALQGHQGDVMTLAVLPDDRVVSGSDDKTLRVWDLQTGRLVATLQGHEGGVTALAVLPDGRIVSGSHDNTLRVWDLKDRKTAAILKGHQGGVTALAVLPDGRILSCSYNGILQVWDVKTRRSTSTIHPHLVAVSALEVLPDGRIVVSRSHSRTLSVWHVEPMREVATLEGHHDTVMALAVLPGDRIVSGSNDGTLRVWNLENEQADITLQGHRGEVNALVALPHGHVVSGSADQTLRVWDVETGRAVATIQRHHGGVWALAVSPDGRFVSDWDDKTLRVWDVDLRQAVVTLQGNQDLVVALAVLPDGRVISGSGHQAIQVWDVERRCVVATLQGRQKEMGIVALAVLPDGRVVTGTANDTALRVWDVKTGRTVATLQSDQSGVTALAVLPDGRVVSGSFDATILVWDMETGRTVATLQGHQSGVKALAVLPDGRIVSGSYDNTLRIWDVKTGRTLATIYGDAPFFSVACVNQYLIVAGDNAGNVWFIDLPDLPRA